MSIEQERVNSFGKLENGLRQASDWYLWGPPRSPMDWPVSSSSALRRRPPFRLGHARGAQVTRRISVRVSLRGGSLSTAPTLGRETRALTERQQRFHRGLSQASLADDDRIDLGLGGERPASCLSAGQDIRMFHRGGAPQHARDLWWSCWSAAGTSGRAAALRPGTWPHQGSGRVPGTPRRPGRLPPPRRVDQSECWDCSRPFTVIVEARVVP